MIRFVTKCVRQKKFNNKINSPKEKYMKLTSQTEVEIIQVVQNLKNEVSLIQGKKTYARVYPSYRPTIKPRHETVDATLIAINGKTLNPPLKLETPLTIERSESVNRDYQRHHWDSSFNFDLTQFIINAKADSRINSVEMKYGDNTLTLPIKNDASCIAIKKSDQLTVTALILEYWHEESESYVSPEPVEVDSIRQFIESTFPIMKLIWKTITVRATDEFRSLAKTSNRQDEQPEIASRELRELLLQTLVHRNMDTLFRKPYKRRGLSRKVAWENNNDHLSLYLAVYADPSDRLGGAATDSPTQPLHNIVAAAAVDNNGQLGAHELAHLLGRTHPGVPDRNRHGPFIGQRQIDPAFSGKTNEQGFLSFNSASDCIGLQIDDGLKNPKVLENNRWFDLMTYRDPQWISRHTFLALMERIEKLSVRENFPIKKKSCWLLIGEYDLNRKTGNILYAFPTSYFVKSVDPNPTRKKITLEANLFTLDASDNRVSVTAPIQAEVFYREINETDTARKPKTDMPGFGIYQAMIDIKDEEFIDKVEMKIFNQLVDVYGGLQSQQIVHYQQIVSDTETLWKGLDKNKKTGVFNNGIEAQGPQNNRKKIAFVYNIIKDEYAIHYNWANKSENKSFDDKSSGKKSPKESQANISSKIITVFQCRNKHAESGKQPCWETVLVTTRQKGKAWISPTFVHRDGRDDVPNFDNNALQDLMTNVDDRPLEMRREDSIEIRVLFSSGFSYDILNPITLYADVVFSRKRLESLQERRCRLRDRQQRVKERNPNGRYRPMYPQSDDEIQKNANKYCD
jgi:hypothetical protein